MIDLNKYQRDGAGSQAKAVLAYMQETSGIEASWNDEFKKYMADYFVLERQYKRKEKDNMITIKITNKLEVSDLPLDIVKELESILIMDNPLWLQNVEHGYSNFKTPRQLRYIKQNKKGNYEMPRGFINRLQTILKDHNLKYETLDKTISLSDDRGEPQGLNLSPVKTRIRDYQNKAVLSVLPCYRPNFNILQAPTGSGKTVMALFIINATNEPTLIIVHTKELLYQWRDRIEEFLGIPKEDIGLIGDGNKKIKPVTVAIVNSLYKIVDKIAYKFGFLIVDECHRAPSKTFSHAVSYFKSKHMLGLSATPYRRDGLTDVMHFFLGDTAHVIDTKELQEEGHIMKPILKVIETDFNCYVASGAEYGKVITTLVEDEKRNDLIIDNIIKQTEKDDGIALVISDRKEHCQTLYYAISKKMGAFVLTGNTTKIARKKIIEEINHHQDTKVLIATGQLIGEGFDLASISSIFLTTPTKGGRLIQYIGRGSRMCKGKDKFIIHDFSDKPWILQHSFRQRLKTYKELGITV